jgi:hypothetical protein
MGRTTVKQPTEKLKFRHKKQRQINLTGDQKHTDYVATGQRVSQYSLLTQYFFPPKVITRNFRNLHWHIVY